MGSRQDDGITRCTSVAPRNSGCQRWLQFLEEATAGDRELIRFLQQWCGYCLTGIIREHALVFVYGPGGNGKSVFLNILTFILKSYATTAAMDTFTASKGDKQQRIFLRADKHVSYGDLMGVMDLLRDAGYLKIALVGLDGSTTAAPASQAPTQPVPAP